MSAAPETTDDLEQRLAEVRAASGRDSWVIQDGEIVFDYRHDAWLGTVPARFHHATIDDLEGHVAAAVDEWRQDMNRGLARNLLITGNVGVGKTHAAIAAARRAHFAGRRVRFWPVVDLLDALRPGGDPDALDRAIEADVLVLDDLGQEKATDWAGERLYLLVNRRWMDGAPIIATSNLAASNGAGPLVDAIGQRVYSRLVHNAVTLRIGGRDRRRPS